VDSILQIVADKTVVTDHISEIVRQSADMFMRLANLSITPTTFHITGSAKVSV